MILKVKAGRTIQVCPCATKDSTICDSNGACDGYGIPDTAIASGHLRLTPSAA